MLEQYKQTKSLLGDKVELRLLADEDVKVAIAMNEKIAGIRKERWINSGFTSDDINFHKWCSDIFTFYWDRAKKPIKLL